MTVTPKDRVKKGCIKKDHLGSRRAIMTLFVTLCVLLLLLPLSKTCSCTYHIGPVCRNMSLRFILFDESFRKRKRRSLFYPTKRWYDFKHQELDLWWDGMLIVILIENCCSMHLGWFRMKDDRFLTSPPFDSYESSKNFLQKMTTKNSGIWNLQKSQGQPRYQDGHQSISASFLFTHLDAFSPINWRLWRLQTVELLRELVGLKEATEGKAIRFYPHLNLTAHTWKWLVGIHVSFWDWANCYFQGV